MTVSQIGCQPYSGAALSSPQTTAFAALDDLSRSLSFPLRMRESVARESITKIGNESQGQEVLGCIYQLISLAPLREIAPFWQLMVSYVAGCPAEVRLHTMCLAQRLVVKTKPDPSTILDGVQIAGALCIARMGTPGEEDLPFSDPHNCTPKILEWIENHHDDKKGKCDIFNKIFKEIYKDHHWPHRRALYQGWVNEAPEVSAERVQRQQAMEIYCPTRTPEQRLEGMHKILGFASKRIHRKESAKYIIDTLNELISVYRIGFKEFSTVTPK